jgi:hypothetical protein
MFPKLQSTPVPILVTGSVVASLLPCGHVSDTSTDLVIVFSFQSDKPVWQCFQEFDSLAYSYFTRDIIPVHKWHHGGQRSLHIVEHRNVETLP